MKFTAEDAAIAEAGSGFRPLPEIWGFEVGRAFTLRQAQGERGWWSVGAMGVEGVVDSCLRGNDGRDAGSVPARTSYGGERVLLAGVQHAGLWRGIISGPEVRLCQTRRYLYGTYRERTLSG